MAKILLLETTTNICSVALLDGNDIIAHKISTEPNAHSSMLTLFIDELFREARLTPKELDAVAISSGPGSYTGLRIGVSTAKAICYAISCPLISVDTLEAMTYGIQPKYPHYQGLYCPMIDARRMEVYAAIFDKNLHRIRDTEANIIGEGDLEKYLAQEQVLFFGNAVEKAIPILSDYPNALFDETFINVSIHLKIIALQKFRNKQFENMAYYEPFYLKDYVAIKSTIKGLH